MKMAIYCTNRPLWLILLLVTSALSSARPEKKVCIIGAGVSGLVSAKLLTENINNVEPIVFESNTEIGGQWKYTESTDLDEHGLPEVSGVYKNLRTNGPKVLMSLPDYKEFHGENRSYVGHETVLEYLKNYTERFDLRRYIKLDTLVEKVNPTQDEKWLVETRDLNTNESKVHTCDAVMVCNGHFTKPYIPKIPGLDTFSGRTLHSHSHRHPEEYTGKTVALLGASYSGQDIGVEVSKYAKKIYLSHRHEKITEELPENLVQVPGVVAANGTYLILSNGSRIDGVDVFMFCTGYLYDYPFLDESSDITVTQGKYVHPLYNQLVSVDHPTMVFVGLPHPGFPFVVPYYQVHYFISLLRGDAKLPSRAVMLKDSRLPPGTPVSKAHYMDIIVMKYCNDLANISGVEPISEPLKKAALLWQKDKKDVMHFKDNELFIRDDGRVELIRPNNTVTIV